MKTSSARRRRFAPNCALSSAFRSGRFHNGAKMKRMLKSRASSAFFRSSSGCRRGQKRAEAACHASDPGRARKILSSRDIRMLRSIYAASNQRTEKLIAQLSKVARDRTSPVSFDDLLGAPWLALSGACALDGAGRPQRRRVGRPAAAAPEPRRHRDGKLAGRRQRISLKKAWRWSAPTAPAQFSFSSSRLRRCR